MEEGILFNSAFVAEYQFYPNFVKKIFYSLKFLYFSSLYLISIKCKEIISIIFVETSFVNFIWMVWVGWVFLVFFWFFFFGFFLFLRGVAAVNCPSFLCVFFSLNDVYMINFSSSFMLFNTQIAMSRKEDTHNL